MPQNDFISYGGDPSANVQPLADYGADADRTHGVPNGVQANAQKYNRALRQAATMSAALGGLIAAEGFDALDNGDLSALLLNLTNAVNRAARLPPIIATYSGPWPTPSGTIDQQWAPGFYDEIILEWSNLTVNAPVDVAPDGTYGINPAIKSNNTFVRTATSFAYPIASGPPGTPGGINRLSDGFVRFHQASSSTPFQENNINVRDQGTALPVTMQPSSLTALQAYVGSALIAGIGMQVNAGAIIAPIVTGTFTWRAR